MFPIPKMYDEMPFPKGYFEEDPKKIGTYKVTDFYDYNTAFEYCRKVGKEIYELTAAEAWMFKIDKDDNYLNNNYEHYLATGEVRPYDGPKKTAKDDEIRQEWEKRHPERAN